ncbi:caspase-1-like [Neodiprion virginianus]|uniref:caspase-1-like n=1 Tax=Neodiprion virginianus TaxID=2961670 RepID=UPI001EE73113|nr:caspase-1-like [Neodiprion virginianus]
MRRVDRRGLDKIRVCYFIWDEVTGESSRQSHLDKRIPAVEVVMSSSLTVRENRNQSFNKEKISGSQTEQETATDETDAWLFRRKKNNDDADSVASVASSLESTVVSSKTERDSEVYDMSHPRRGVALIFNHIHFVNMATRTGTIKDCKNLGEALDSLGFEVRVYNDPSFKTISQVLRSVAAEDHSDADCLVVSAMSHGESGFLHSSDELYSVDRLWTSFTGDLCPSLAGKPKLFFIQACRGNRLDQGVTVIHETDSATSYSIPAYADIMVAYSTYDGFYSWRNPDAGSWFIQAICKELAKNGRSRDLLTIMTFVNRRVALDFQSYVPQNAKMHAKKQIPSVVSMLTRLVYFSKKSGSLRYMNKVTAL